MTKPQSNLSIDAFVERNGIVTQIQTHPIRILGLVAALLVLPFILVQTGYQYWLTLMVEFFVFAIAVLSFDLLFGYTGLLSFGHALFFGMGTYTVAIVTRETSLSFLGAVPIALIAVPILAVLIGLVALRLKGVYFAIIMLAFGQLGYQIILQLGWLTGGVNGISGLAIPTLFGINPTESYAAYYITLFVLACVYVGLQRVVNSPFGHILQGVDQNEDRMRTLGINVYRHKLASFTLAAFIGGISGLLYPLYVNFVNPSLVNWTTTGDILMMTLIGGIGTLWGPVLGAGFYIFIQGLLESVTDQWRIVLGAIFVFVVLLFPSGIAGLFDDNTSIPDELYTIRERVNNLIADQEESRDE